MFKVSSKADYGLLIMMELATCPDKIMPLSPIAKRLQVSSAYLSQIAKSLQKAGLILSREGAGGGYYLAREADNISVWSILEALTGRSQAPCELSKTTCPNFCHCGLKSAWPVLLHDIQTTLAKRTLASLVN